VRSPDLGLQAKDRVASEEWVVPGLVEVKAFKSDFNLDFYDPNNLSTKQVETHVRAFFGEKLLQPRSEELWIGRDGTLDPDYVAMMHKSINYWRVQGDEKAAVRFEKELEGAENIVQLILLSASRGEPLPIVLNASDPGDFYVDSEGNKKSVTFLWMLNEVGDGGWNYKILSLPTKFIGIEKHWELLEKLGNVQKTKNILQIVMKELTANELIAFPVLFNEFEHSLNELATSLGYKSWEDIERIAANQLELEKDPYAKERREKMIDEFTTRILDTVKGYRSQDEKEALVNAMADMFALEAGKEYLEWRKEKIALEIAKNVRLALADKLKIFDQPQEHSQNWSVEFGDIAELYAQRTWMMNAFRNNPLAREARATGCGGSGMSMSDDIFASLNASSFMDNMGITDTGQFDYWTNNIAKQFGSSNLKTESSTGKYKEYYDYKPGVCTHCHEHKLYVAYPKSTDIPCAGWCSDCEV
jgi:hypothetical protein